MKRLPSNRFFRNTHQERSSVLVLIMILLILVMIYIYIHWHPPSPAFSLESIKVPETLIDQSSDIEPIHPGSKKENTLFPFNPNEVTREELIGFGIPAKTASVWIHFLDKGGTFKNPEDVKKVYGLNDELYHRIAPFIQFQHPSLPAQAETNTVRDKKPVHAIDPNLALYPDLVQAGFPERVAHTLINYRTSGKTFHSIQELSKLYGMTDSILRELTPYISLQNNNTSNAPSASEIFTASVPAFIDLNKADSTSLKQLPGIGHTLALRIIAYREKLGGYYTLGQLNEVYGLKDTIVSRIQPHLTLSAPYRKIKINQDSLPGRYHPYITKKDAILIQNYLDQHRPIKSASNLIELKAFDQKYWDRLIPYLDFSIK